MLDDVALFVAIAETGGLALAARRLGLPPATVTRRLQRLEERLGCRLVHRSARRFSLTGEGEAYLRRLGPLMAQLDHALRGLSADLTQMRGPLRVMAPTNLSVDILRPMWAAFVAAHPEVELDLRLSNRVENLVEAGADLALRVGPQPDSGLTRRRLGLTCTIVVGAPGYLRRHGCPDDPAALERHRIIGTAAVSPWLLIPAEGGRAVTPPLSPATRLDDVGLGTHLAREGLGLALLPVTQVAADIRAGRLVHVLPGWRGPEREIFAVWPSGRLLSERARVLVDHMAAHVAGEPALQGRVPEPDRPGPAAG
ncbi:LysR family transcriptional regulator [Mangrovicoccus algicola]|uniref:LysR family transcriptional regulator n=1 Tax=Mangrovicoccus algicola TaxID=2771008 RepID=A0A8J6Z4Y3_9RHOB|nr:LysR family transcriptional regulator [Mangrovicoccus algicola]MBE3637749.1 LysR family transcriptional regulator [Mangrovicoccus algicola]